MSPVAGREPVPTTRLVGARSCDTGQPIELAVTIPGGHEAAVDVSGLLVAPGYVDLQVNGAFGHDVTTDPGSIWELGAQLPRWGVTAFLPTIISSAPEVVARAQEVLRLGPPPGWRGALPLGLHCEGPLIAPDRRGTHPASALLMPGSEAGRQLIDRWGGLEHIRMVTLAPELPGAAATTRKLVAAGAVVAAGHSDAGYDAAVTSFGWGVSHGTHLFNAMSGVEHRRPGLAAALLATPGVTAGLIVDGVHVHPGAVAAAWRAKGPAGIAVVTDAMAAAGLGDGSYRLGGVAVTVEGDRAVNREGRLAGSVITMDRAVRNLRGFTGCTVAEAIQAASTTPASVLGDAGRGGLRSGPRTDAILLDATMRVRLTVVDGHVVFDGIGLGDGGGSGGEATVVR